MTKPLPEDTPCGPDGIDPAVQRKINALFRAGSTHVESDITTGKLIAVHVEEREAPPRTKISSNNACTTARTDAVAEKPVTQQDRPTRRVRDKKRMANVHTPSLSSLFAMLYALVADMFSTHTTVMRSKRARDMVSEEEKSGIHVRVLRLPSEKVDRNGDEVQSVQVLLREGVSAGEEDGEKERTKGEEEDDEEGVVVVAKAKRVRQILGDELGVQAVDVERECKEEITSALRRMGSAGQ